MSNNTISYSSQQGKPGHGFMAQLFGFDGQSIAVIESTDDPAVASDRARRLAAAWNALDGVSTDHLEKYGLPDFAQKISDLAERRDELLAALKDALAILEANGKHFGRAAQLKASTAIDKIDGTPVASEESRYYLQDTRGYVGNCPLWWGLNSKGYTTDLCKAHRYTLEETMKQHQCRGTDLPWLCSEIDQLQRPTVDAQDMHKMRSNSEQRAALAKIGKAT